MQLPTTLHWGGGLVQGRPLHSPIYIEKLQIPRGARLLININRPAHAEYTDTHIEIDAHRQPYASAVDNAEREYRERFRPRPSNTDNFRVNEYTVDGEPCYQPRDDDVKFTQDTVEPFRLGRADQKSKMGYYDEDGLLRPLYWSIVMLLRLLLIPSFRPLPLFPPRHAQARGQDCPPPRPRSH